MCDEELRKKVFFLSYYTLEKALSLSYLVSYNPRHEKYLNIEDKLLLQNWRPLLGSLISIDITIHEGHDSREWVYEKDHGGHKFETFLHHLLLASMFVGLPEYWNDLQLTEDESGNEIQLRAKSSNTNIHLSMKKNAEKCDLRRYIELVFSGGTITTDIDSQSTVIYFADMDKTCHISVKKHFVGKYRILTDLVKEIRDGKCTTEEVDGLHNQLRIIRWLLEY